MFFGILVLCLKITSAIIEPSCNIILFIDELIRFDNDSINLFLSVISFILPLNVK